MRLDAALLAVKVDDGLSFPAAQALDKEAVPYAFVTGVGDMVKAEPQFARKPLVKKPHCAAEIIDALHACGVIRPRVAEQAKEN